MKYAYIILLFLFGIAISCVPVIEDPANYVLDPNLNDPELMKILDFGDDANVDSLYPFLRSQYPNKRYLAASSFASIKDKETIDSLAILLDDEEDRIRAMAAYAIGQTGSSRAEEILIEAFDSNDSLNQHTLSNSTILEAVGKCGSKKYLELLGGIKTYTRDDSLLLLGQTRGIYRYGLREITSPIATQLMVNYVTNPNLPSSVRLMAAHYLQRAKNIDLEPFVYPLSKELSTSDNSHIKMSLVIALGKAGTSEAFNQLSNAFDNEVDERVRANIIRTIQNFDYSKTRDLIYQALEDEHFGVRTVASEHILNQGTEDDALAYRQLARNENKAIPIRARLYAAANRHLPAYYAITKGNINAELKIMLDASKDPFDKAAIIQALGEEAQNAAYIKDKTFNDSNPIVRSAGVRAMGQILKAPYFLQSVSRNPQKAKSDIVGYLVEAIRTKESSLISIAAGILRDEDLKLDNFFDDLSILESILETIDKSINLTAYNELNHTISHFKGNDSFVAEKNPNRRGINWGLQSKITDSTLVKVITNNGTFEFELFHEHSPSSVANFIDLIQKNYYNGKYFHRVVPNFVIQTGSPNGDGYGGLNYTIRSELGPAYYDDEGYVGMASSGNHTECTQWFVTHSPTPHLDGNYTIFGKIVSGMNVVRNIKMGDVIQEIKILDFISSPL